MQKLLFILALYFFALATITCADDPLIKANGRGNSFLISDVHPNCDNSSNKSDDNCSPLCFCNCCQITASSSSADSEPLCYAMNTEIRSSYFTVIPESPLNFLFRPPKA